MMSGATSQFQIAAPIAKTQMNENQIPRISDAESL